MMGGGGVKDVLRNVSYKVEVRSAKALVKELTITRLNHNAVRLCCNL